MKQKNILSILLMSALAFSAPVSAEENANLVKNGGFEQYSCNPIFGCSFDDWSGQGSGASASTDKLEGEVALMMNPVTASVLDQAVSLSDANYAIGSLFELTVNYKVVTMPDGGSLALDCYWEAAAGGNSDEIAAHDAEVLRAPLDNENEWKTIRMKTTKPSKSSYLRIRVKVPKNAKVLFDDIQLVKTESAEPFIEVTPNKVASVSCEKGQSVDFPALHIKQGNVTGVTTFELSYTDADQFRLSQSSLGAEESSCDLIITYAPTKAGTHRAVLNIDNTNHTSLFQSLTLNASCTDPSAVPSLSVTPSVIPAFETVAGKQVSGTFSVKSENCTDVVYLSVSHIKGTAFTITSSMLAKNWESEVTVYFTPMEAGTYESEVTISSEGAESVVLKLQGTAREKSEETIDWSTEFSWDASHPLALLIEDFESSKHNETLLLEGWQNVAGVKERPWWGYDESRATPPRGANKCAKATAYEYAKDRTGIWESWLVTPALDYKNAAGKVFTFDVMAEYLPEEGSETVLEVYYVFLDENGNAGFQDLTGSFDIPVTGSDNEVWRTFHLNLNNQPDIADVFFIAFRYVGPNGGDGAVTYYIDNVSWGRDDLPTITPSEVYLIDSLAIVNQERVIGTLHIEGANLTEEIRIEVAGSRYTNFSLSTESLPAEGGDVTITFLSDLEGVHEAYLLLSSEGAADVYVPMAVLCRSEAAGFLSPSLPQGEGVKILRNGKIIIRSHGKEYLLTGAETNVR